METLLHRRLGDHLPRTPPPRRLLQATDVQDAVVHVIGHLLVRVLPEERPVRVHAVARQEGPRIRHVLLDVREELVGRLLRRHRRREHGVRQPALGVRPGAPLVHHVHPLFRLMDHGPPAILIDDLEGACRDDAEDFNDLVVVGIETRHLIPLVSELIVTYIGSYQGGFLIPVPHNQSISRLRWLPF